MIAAQGDRSEPLYRPASVYNPGITRGGLALPRIFVSQRRVQQWTEEGRVAIESSWMTLTELGRTFRLTEAFFVERAVSDGGDAHQLSGRVKTRQQIASLGGEVFLNSLIIGDDAYEGDPGFIGEPVSKKDRPRTSRRDGGSLSGIIPASGLPLQGVVAPPPPPARQVTTIPTADRGDTTGILHASAMPTVGRDRDRGDSTGILHASAMPTAGRDRERGDTTGILHASAMPGGGRTGRDGPTSAGLMPPTAIPPPPPPPRSAPLSSADTAPPLPKK